jgi:hypothetical protein
VVHAILVWYWRVSCRSLAAQADGSAGRRDVFPRTQPMVW